MLERGEGCVALVSAQSKQKNQAEGGFWTLPFRVKASITCAIATNNVASTEYNSAQVVSSSSSSVIDMQMLWVSDSNFTFHILHTSCR